MRAVLKASLPPLQCVVKVAECCDNTTRYVLYVWCKFHFLGYTLLSQFGLFWGSKYEERIKAQRSTTKTNNQESKLVLGILVFGSNNSG